MVKAVFQAVEAVACQRLIIDFDTVAAVTENLLSAALCACFKLRQLVQRFQTAGVYQAAGRVERGIAAKVGWCFCGAVADLVVLHAVGIIFSVRSHHLRRVQTGNNLGRLAGIAQVDKAVGIIEQHKRRVGMSGGQQQAEK